MSKQLQTVYDVFKKVLKEDEWLSYYLQEYLDYYQKYSYALQTMADIDICPTFSPYKETGITEEEANISDNILMKFINFTRTKKDDAHKKLVEILDEKIPLSKIKNIQGYTEFDFIKWEFKNDTINLVWKPKNVSVSCWGVDTKNVAYE